MKSHYFYLIGIILVFSIINLPYSDSYIPPTRAFNQIISGAENVTAKNSTAILNLISGSNIAIDLDYDANSITIAATGVGSGNVSSNIDQIGNVYAPTPLTNQSLVFNGTLWIPQTATGFEVARQSLVTQLDDEKLLDAIGTNFTDPYSTANATGHATLIDTNGKSTVRLQILWQKIGSGTQTCQIVDIDNASNVLITSASLTTGINDSGDISIPAGLASTVKNYKIQCKSTVGTDSPSLFGFRVFLR